MATFSAINATIYGNVRMGFIIAKEGELPEKLDDEKHNIPVAGVVIITVISLLMANLIDLTEIAIIGSAGFLFIFTIVNFSALKLASQIGTNKFIALLASLASTAALVTLIIHTYQSNMRAVLVFLAFIVFSLAFEFFYGRLVRGHFFQRDYKK